MKRKTNKHIKKKNKRTVLIVLAVIVALLGMAAILMGKDAMTLLQCEKELKAEVKTVAKCLLSGDTDTAAKSAAELDLTLSQTDDILAKPCWKAAAKELIVGRDISTVRSLLNIAQDCSDSIIKPVIDVLREYPLKQNGDPSISFSALPEYVSLADNIMPDVQRCADAIQQLPRMRIPRLEKKLTEIRAYAELAGPFLPMLDDILPPVAATLRETPLPDNMKLSFGSIKSIDEQTADTYLTLAQEISPQVCECLAQLHTVLTDNISTADSKSKEKLTKLDTLVTFAEDALRELAPSAIPVLKSNPLSELLPGDGKINVISFSNYLDYAQQIMPALKEYRQKLMEAMPDGDERADSKLLEKLDKAISLYDRAEQYLPLIRTVLGSGEDRIYLLVAQNSAEIRAAGGFPGAVGMIEVRNGVLSVGDFSTVYAVLPGMTEITDLESDLFSSRARDIRDAEFNPYFPRISKIWADTYEELNAKHVDGVISLTPAIIQEILGVTGEITLSDGTKLDGVNATWVLQNGMYKHYQQSSDSYYNDLTDALFAETAKRSLNEAFSHIDLTKLDAYISIFEKCRDERVLMMWMSDADEQRIIEQAKCDGGFNTDPANPQIGIFFNNYVSSKLGWYFDMDIEVGTGVRNEDGSCSYPVRVTIANTLDWNEVYLAGKYIVGGEYGAMVASLYFAAPANGTLSDFDHNEEVGIKQTNYMGSDIAYANYIYLPVDTSMTISFTATTAPGEQTPLTVAHTPTLQEYRTEGCEYGITDAPLPEPEW